MFLVVQGPRTAQSSSTQRLPVQPQGLDARIRRCYRRTGARAAGHEARGVYVHAWHTSQEASSFKLPGPTFFSLHACLARKELQTRTLQSLPSTCAACDDGLWATTMVNPVTCEEVAYPPPDPLRGTNKWCVHQPACVACCLSRPQESAPGAATLAALHLLSTSAFCLTPPARVSRSRRRFRKSRTSCSRHGGRMLAVRARRGRRTHC